MTDVSVLSQSCRPKNENLKGISTNFTLQVDVTGRGDSSACKSSVALEEFSWVKITLMVSSLLPSL